MDAVGEGGIFIGYRRADGGGPAGRLYDNLAAEFGKDRVFMDVEALEYGTNFTDKINNALGKCDVMIVLIGPGWLSATNERGRRRLDDPGDLARQEIEAGLSNGLRVIPVLVDGAGMPSSSELPTSLAFLNRLHAFNLDHSTFHPDAERLKQFLVGVLNERDIFISYAVADISWAQWIASTIKRAGFRVLIPELGLRQLDEPSKGTPQGITDLTRTVAVLSESYLKSARCAAEWRRALEPESGGRSRLIPVVIEPCSPPGLLVAGGYTDLVGVDAETARDRLRWAVSNQDDAPPFPGHTGILPLGRDPALFSGGTPPRRPDSHRRTRWPGKRAVRAVLAAGMVVVAVGGAWAASSSWFSSSPSSSSSSTASSPSSANLSVGQGFCEEITRLWPDLQPGSVSVSGGGGDDAWRQALQPFERCTGITVNAETAGDDDIDLQDRITAGDPPELLLTNHPGELLSLIEAGAPVRPIPASTTEKVARNFDPLWMTAVSIGEELYAVPVTADVKSLVWYSPRVFEDSGYQVPTTNQELLELSDRISSDGRKPWCAGISEGASTGWPITDWLEDYMLRLNGGVVYDDWVQHRIPFDDPKVLAAFGKVGAILRNPDYVNGGLGDVASIGSTQVVASAMPIVEGDCYLHRQSSGLEPFWPEGTEVATDGDVSAFLMPPIGATDSAMVGGTFMAAFTDRPQAQALQFYLSTPEWARAIVAAGPGLNANRSLTPDDVTSTVRKLAVTTLRDPTTTIRFDASDLMPPEVGLHAAFTQFTGWINDDRSDASTLGAIEEAWPTS